MLQREIDAKLKHYINDYEITNTAELIGAMVCWDLETYATHDFSKSFTAENFFTKRGITGAEQHNPRGVRLSEPQHSYFQTANSTKRLGWGIFDIRKSFNQFLLVSQPAGSTPAYNIFQLKELKRSYEKVLTLYLNSDIISKRFIMETDDTTSLGWQIYYDLMNKVTALNEEIKNGSNESNQCEQSLCV